MADFPLINGNRYDFSSIETNIRGTILRSFKEIAYKNNLEPGEMRGNSPQPGGRTRGEYKPTASFTVPLLEFNELKAALGPGYMEVEFDIVVSYAEKNQPTITDKIIAARIKSADRSFSSGTDALVVKCELSIMFIIEDGISPVTNPRSISL